MNTLGHSNYKCLLEMACHLSLHLMLICTGRKIVSFLKQIEITDKQCFILWGSISLKFSCPNKSLLSALFFIELIGKFIILNTITDVLFSNFGSLV